MNWKKVKLSDIAEIVMGQSPKSKFYNTDGDGLPFFQGRAEFGDIYPNVKKWCTKPLKVAKKNDVLMTVRAPVGDLNIANEECIIGRGLCALRSKLNNGRFLYYLLKGNNSYIISFGSGAVYDAINKDSVGNLIFDIPDEPIQHKIASILSNYDNLIELNERRIKILIEIARLIYKEWFVKFRFPGYEKVRMVESELGIIPDGWEVKKVEDIVMRIRPGKLYDSYTVKKSGKVPVLDQGRSGIIGYHDDEPGVKAEEDNPVIVFANHTCYQNLILFPFSAIQNVLPFIPNNTNFRNILWLHWATKGLVKFHDYKGHWPEFVNKKLIVPPQHICEEFSKLVRLMVLQKYKLQQLNYILHQTRDMLLPKLFSGEINVSDLDIKLVGKQL